MNTFLQRLPLFFFLFQNFCSSIIYSLDVSGRPKYQDECSMHKILCVFYIYKMSGYCLLPEHTHWDTCGTARDAYRPSRRWSSMYVGMHTIPVVNDLDHRRLGARSLSPTIFSRSYARQVLPFGKKRWRCIFFLLSCLSLCMYYIYFGKSHRSGMTKI